MEAPHYKEEAYLKAHGIRPTAVRIRIWRVLSHKTQTFSLYDVEEMLPEMDKSSIFRTLRLFTEHQLLHQIDDGTGSAKYCLCRCEEQGHINHIHFNCILCGKTYCLEHEAIPHVNLPEGYEMQEVEYLVKGVCPQCRR